MKYLIGVDIGTQGTKAAVYDIHGNLSDSAFAASNLLTLTDGRIVQDADEILMSVVSVLKEITDNTTINNSDIAAISFDGQMAGILGIDTDHKAVTYYDSWLDTTCAKYVDIMKLEAEEDLVRITGCPVTIHHGPKILWWKNERPNEYEKICKFVVPSAYVAGRFAGLKGKDAFIDYTQLHFSGFGDVDKLEWSEYLLGKFDVAKDKMPRIVEPWHIAGGITKEFADLTGIPEGTIVAAGCGDQAASSLGAGVTREGMVFDVSGTASVFSCCVGSYKPDLENKTLLYARSVIKDMWIPLAYISGGGLCLKWFRDNLTGQDTKVTFKDLDSEASQISSGSDGLFFVPHFAGRTCPADASIRGAWIGLSWHHTRAHMYRAVMESIAYEYSSYLDILKTRAGVKDFGEVIAVGGGSVSKVFNSIKADVLGVKYSPLDTDETATLGSAVIAGYAAGVFTDMTETVSSFVKRSGVIEPDHNKHFEYKPFRETYKDLFTHVRAPLDKLNKLRKGI